MLAASMPSWPGAVAQSVLEYRDNLRRGRRGLEPERASAPGHAHPLPQPRIVEQAVEGGGQGTRVAGRNPQAGDAGNEVSRRPPTSEATTGRRTSMASMATRPMGSFQTDGTTATEQPFHAAMT